MQERGDRIFSDYVSKGREDIYVAALLVDEFSDFPICGLSLSIHNSRSWKEQVVDSGLTEAQAKWLYWNWAHQEYTDDLLCTMDDRELISAWVDQMGYTNDNRDSYHDTRNRFWGLAAYYGTTLRGNSAIPPEYRDGLTIILDNNHEWEWPVHAATAQLNPDGQGTEWLNTSIPDIA